MFIAWWHVWCAVKSEEVTCGSWCAVLLLPSCVQLSADAQITHTHSRAAAPAVKQYIDTLAGMHTTALKGAAVQLLPQQLSLHARITYVCTHLFVLWLRPANRMLLACHSLRHCNCSPVSPAQGPQLQQLLQPPAALLQ